MKFAQIVIGPAGSGKSTYCSTLQQHCATIGRSVHIVNLDPAAEEFTYDVSFDVRDLITLEDAMEEMDLGPNGGLVFCMEFLEENLTDWLGEELQAYGEDDYLLFDCPGQLELYTHIPVIRSFVDYLRNDSWNVCAVYCLDCHFITEASKYIAGAFQALSAMVALEIPHINVLTKVDLLPSKDDVEDFLYPDPQHLLTCLSGSMPSAFRHLNNTVANMVHEFGMVGFLPLDISDEDSIGEVLLQIDTAIQYGEDLDVKIRDQEEEEPQDDDDPE